MDIEAVGNLYQCIPIGDLSLHNLIVSVLPVSLSDIREESIERRRPGLPLFNCRIPKDQLASSVSMMA
jgi:hypothetical protein